MRQCLEKLSIATVSNSDVNDLRWSTKEQSSIIEVHVFTEDDKISLGCSVAKSAYQSPLKDYGQKRGRLRDDAISAKHIGAAEDSHRQETSLAQQDFAMGCVTRRILKRRIDVGFFKVWEVL
jgi:hypothetical protein